MESFKEEHEQFISGHNGTSYSEVAMLTSISCLACILRDLFCLSSSQSTDIFRPRLFTEFLLVIFPNILSVTLLQEHLVVLTLSILLVISVLFVNKKRAMKAVWHTLNQINLDRNKNFVTYYRAVVVLCTAVAILAVDFPVFPRRFAKAETYGFGGMDIGVGLFVVANGIVSPEARNKPRDTSHALTHLRRTFVSCVPLFLLGLARLLAVKGTNYHEHVTEYGVHWNFFFTLLALKVFLTLMYLIVPVHRSTLIALAVLLSHQFLLSNGLSLYIINGFKGNGERDGLLDANREGIFSLPGYITIYLFGVQLGHIIFQEKTNLTGWLQVAKTITFQFIIFTVSMFTTHFAVEPVSRRLANAAFVFWVMSISYLMILVLLLGDIGITFLRSQHRKSKSDSILQSKNVAVTKKLCLLTAVNFNSLFTFLLANVMTGLVNMFITTHHTADISAVLIITCYMFLLCYTVGILYTKNISVKIFT